MLPRAPLFRFFLLLLSLCAVLCACKQEGPRRAAEPPTVAWIHIRPERLALDMELLGRTKAFLTAEVRPQVDGIILERRFTEGTDVRAGKVLYRIDPALYRAAVESAKAALAEARAALAVARRTEERYRPLAAKKAVSREDFDKAQAARQQAEARVEAARAALETAAVNLAYTEVKAPVSGRIGRSSVTPGALVTRHQSEALATVQNLEKIYVDLRLSSVQWLDLQAAFAEGRLKSPADADGTGGASLHAALVLENGATYARRLPDGGGEPIQGLVQFTEVTVGESTGALTVRALFPNPDRLLLPGMHVRCVMREGVDEAAVLIPQKALRFDNKGRALALVLRESPEKAGGEPLFTLEQRVLELGRTVGNRQLIRAGLSPGERVAADGGLALPTGQKVRAAAEEQRAETADAKEE